MIFKKIMEILKKKDIQTINQTNEKGKVKMKTNQQINASLPRAAFGLPIIEMVKVEPGTCQKTVQESNSDVTATAEKIKIQYPFWIATTMVTESQWKAVMGNLPKDPKPGEAHGDNFPVVYVSWNKAQEFVAKLNSLVDGNYKFSLPSEDEWEYAAQGGHKNSGTTIYAGGNNPNDVAWYWNDKVNSDNKLHEVAQKKPNELGVYDMCGNAWEWCSDEHLFIEKGQKVAYKAARGSDFGRPETVCTIALPKVAKAGKFKPDSVKNCYGLRLVLKSDASESIPDGISFDLSNE